MTVAEESRTIARLLDNKNHLFLEKVSWETYQAILDEVEGDGRHFRHTYDRGRLEITTRSAQHEIPKCLLGVFVHVLAEELKVNLYMGGELTLQRKAVRRGIEPDQCYWIANESRVRGKMRFDFRKDPPPDLFLEVEVSRTIISRLAVLAVLGVPEVWRARGKKVRVGLLQADGEYHWGERSPSFPGIPIGELGRFLEMARTMDHLSVIRAFRACVREELTLSK